jgi:ATP-dependent Clp protease ATP-binding subunit ClpC
MYELFTDRARKSMQLANQEAQRFNHEYIGPEHILIGVMKEGSGVGCNVLQNMGISTYKVMSLTRSGLKKGSNLVTMGDEADGHV